MLERASALLLAALLAAAPAAAQQAADDTDGPPRWGLTPRIGVNHFGHRWSEGSGGWRLGPGAGPALGASLQLRPGGRLGYELIGEFSRTNYAIDRPASDPSDEIRFRAGSLWMTRVAAGIMFRLRETVPGYFSLGAGALYHNPSERVTTSISDTGEERYLFADDAQWMPSAHAGVGYELVSGGHALQLDARAFGLRPAQDRVTGAGGDVPAKSLVVDLVFSLGYRIGL